MARVEKDDDREHRIDMKVVVDACSAAAGQYAALSMHREAEA